MNQKHRDVWLSSSKTFTVWCKVPENMIQYFVMSGVCFWNITFNVGAVAELSMFFLPAGKCFLCISLASFFPHLLPPCLPFCLCPKKMSGRTWVYHKGNITLEVANRLQSWQVWHLILFFHKMLWVIFIKIQMLVPLIGITYCKMKINSCIHFNFYKPVILPWLCSMLWEGVGAQICSSHQIWGHNDCSASVLTDFMLYCCVKTMQPWKAFYLCNYTITKPHWIATNLSFPISKSGNGRRGRDRRKRQDNKGRIQGRSIGTSSM